MNTSTRKRLRFRLGERVTTIGNDEKNGVVHGFYKGLYVISLDKPYRIRTKAGGVVQISTVLCHPDNVVSSPRAT